MSTPHSGATDKNPSHPIVLDDGESVPLGLMLINPRGAEADVTAIRRNPYPTTGLKISQKETEYSDTELPFSTTHQDDFSGGRAAEKFEKDKTRLADIYRAHTMYSEQVFPGSQEHYTTGHGQTSVDYWLTSTTREHAALSFNNAIKIAKKFVAPVTAASFAVQVMVEQFDTPANQISCLLYTDSAGSPNTLLGSLLPITTVDHGVHVVTFAGFPDTGITSGTTYWVVFVNGDAQLRYLTYNIDDTTTQKTKRYDGSWSLVSGELYCRVFRYYTKPTASFLFQYKTALYAVKGNKLYINGDRGVCDTPGAHSLDDSSKAWTSGEFVGATVIITRGPAAGKFSVISNNGTNYLNLVDGWLGTTTASEYVIVGANTWREVLDLTNSPTDYEVVGENVYFAFGSTAVVKRYNCYNLAGTYTERNANETVYAEKILSTYDSGEVRWNLWGSNDDTVHGFGVWKMSVPPFWAPLFRDRGDLLVFDSPMDDDAVTNVTVAKSATVDEQIDITVAAGFTTGILARKDITAIDLTKGSKIGMVVRSSVNTSSGDLQLIFANDEINTNTQTRNRVADRMFLYDLTAGSFTDLPKACDGTGNSNQVVAPTTNQVIMVCLAKPADNLRFLMTVVNTNNCLMGVSYFSAAAGTWAGLTINDGTQTAGPTSFGQSGTVTFTLPDDWAPHTFNSQTGYWLMVSFTANLSGTTAIADTRSWMTPTALSLPALVANTYTWVELSGTFNARPMPDDSSVVSLALYLNTDLGAQTINILGTMLIMDPVPEYIAVQTQSKINSLTAFGSDVANPWIVAAEGELFEIQTQNNNAVVRVPLDELRTIASPILGEAAATADVYLYFSAGKRIERYHERLLENIGPDLDNGLPSDRAGNVTNIISAPGNSIICVVDGTRQPCVLVRKSGWHEVYRAPMFCDLASKMPITGIYLQQIPGAMDLLWVIQGQDILWLKYPLGSSEDAADYCYGSSIIVPWVSMGFLDVSKRFMLLKLYTESLVALRTVRVFYQLESGSVDSGWTEIQDDYDTSPFQTEALSNTYSVAARRIRFKILFYNRDFETRPVLKAWIMGALLSLDVKYSYTLPVLLGDGIGDLLGNKDYSLRIEDLQAKLDAWLTSPPTVLTLSSIYSTMDQMKVIVLPYSLKPLSVKAQSQEETQYAEITLLQVA